MNSTQSQTQTLQPHQHANIDPTRMNFHGHIITAFGSHKTDLTSEMIKLSKMETMVTKNIQMKGKKGRKQHATVRTV